MSIAARMPTSSLCSVPSADSSLPIDPAAAVVMPALCAGCVASSTRPAIAGVSAPDPMSRSTGANAVCSSLASSPAVFPDLLSGLVTLNTCGWWRIAFTEAVTASLFASSVSFPVLTSKTIGFTPFCCGGKRSVSRFLTLWLPVPGRERSLLVWAPIAETAAPTPTATSAQRPITTSAWRALNAPSLCSNRATRPSRPPGPPKLDSARPGDPPESRRRP
jgi:hypothetical protein